MKKLILLLCICAAAFYACKSGSDKNMGGTDTMNIKNAPLPDSGSHLNDSAIRNVDTARHTDTMSHY